MTTRVSADIYQISEYLESIKAKHIPAEDSNSLMLGMFGYLGDVFSNQIQDNIILSSQWMDEIFPIRANLEKNLLTHAMMARIENLNAIPSRMDMLIGIKEEAILKNMKNDVLKLDTTIPFFIEDYEMHLENNVNIFRQSSSSGDNVYLAQYELNPNNRLATIDNPYLLPPVKTRVGRDVFVFIRVRLREVQYFEYSKKIISSNFIDNKYMEFTYQNQLSDFILKITKSSGEVIEFKPIFSNNPVLDDNINFVRYTFPNANTLRTELISDIYEPKINDLVEVKIITTHGDKGNFSYKNDIMMTPNSTLRRYENLSFLCKIVNPAEFGMNKKSVDELKRIIPRELLSRGSITCTKDLDNFFNTINDRFSRMKFEKKIDNQFERTYSSYMLLKDSLGNIVPTNTIDINAKMSDFSIVDNRVIIPPGTAFEYDTSNNVANRINPSILTTGTVIDKEKNGFLYTSPYTIVINRSPLLTSHYLTIFNRKYNLIFKQISDIPLLQFISTKVQWKRDMVIDRDSYKMDIDLTQNIDEEYNLVNIDENGIILDCKVKVIGVVYDDKGAPFRYIEATPILYSESDRTYKFRFNFTTNNNITRSASIEILNGKNVDTMVDTPGLFPATDCKMDIFILADLGIPNNNNGMENIYPNINNYTLCNTYEVESGIDFYINYSDIIQSTVRPNMVGSDLIYKISEVPMVRYSHLSDSNNVKYFINYLMEKKVFLDRAIEVLENSFGIDFKFFNTYGKSRVSYIGQSADLLDKTNVSLTFRIKYTTITNTASYTELVKQEIKRYTEDLDNAGDFHMSDVIKILKDKFNFIEYIEFSKINEYDTTHQSIITNRIENSKIRIPEFININSKTSNYIPEIDIITL